MKKTTILKIAISALLLGVASFSAPAVFAEPEDESKSATTEVSSDAPPILIQISPVSSQVILEAGKSKEYTMTVRNSGSSDFTYHLYTTPYFVSDENYNIKSGETQDIKYVVQTPENVPAGGQYAAIFAETDAGAGKDDNSGSSGIRTASRVGMIIYGRTNGETVENGEVTEFNISGFLISGNISATSKVKNSGNTDFEAEYTLRVSSILGAELYNKQTSYNILPDTERRVNLEWADTPFMGIFKVYYKVSTPGDNGTREEEKLVIKFPIIMIILTILVLTGLTIGIIMTIRKRRERNARLAV